MVRGIAFFSIGMIKKVVIADLLARWVNPALGAFESLTFVGAWTAALGYTFQLYYDFCGYSDMAVGLGYLFGLRIPQNFDAPYKALGIRDFWRRWHISLSTWLRDYLYIPLGGNRHGTMRRYINLFVTMLLGGLWHGANWTFVVWGAYHGFLLVLDRIAEPVTEKLPALVFRWLTFILVVAGWVLFRSSDFHMASVWLGKMIGIGAAGTAVVSWIPVAGIIGCFLLANFVPETWDIRFSRRRIYAVAYAVGLFVAFLLMNGNETVFLYYQF
ncbi:MAG: MBOAT family O-acyltransferase [Bryobacteraceae bacterium]